MSDKELIQALRPLAVRDKFQCLGCGHEHRCSTYGCAIIKQAVERLEQLTGPEPNAPLTLEELREMDEEPVWVVVESVNGLDPLIMRVLVEVSEESVWLTNNLGGRSEYRFDESIEDGITIYRRKPEEESDGS